MANAWGSSWGTAWGVSWGFVQPQPTAKGGGIWDWGWHDERRKKKREQLRKAREELGITPSEITADEIVDTVDDYDEDEEEDDDSNVQD